MSAEFKVGLCPMTGRYEISYVESLARMTSYGDSVEEAFEKLIQKTKKNPEAHVGLREILYRITSSWLTIAARENGVPIPDLGME